MVKGEFILKASFVLVLLLINIGSVLSAYDAGAYCSPRCQCPYACMEVPMCENIDVSHFNSVDQTYSGEYVELTAPLEGGVTHDEFYADPYQTEYKYDLNYNYYTSQFEYCNYVWRCTEVLELEECYDDTEYAVDGICSINYDAIDPEDIGDRFCSDSYPGAIFTTVSTNCGPRIMIYKSCSATGGICVQNEGGEPFCTSVCGNNYKSQNEVCDDESGWFSPFTNRDLSKSIVSVINWVELSSYGVSGVANDVNTCENYQPDQLNCEWKLQFGTTYGCYCTEKLTEEKLIETCEENGYFWDDETSNCVFLNEDIEINQDTCENWMDGIWIDSENKCSFQSPTSGCILCQDNSYCGDGVCDDGLDGRNNNYENFQRCPLDCQSPCGNGIPEPEFGEECDNGADNIPVTEWAETKQCMQNCQWVPEFCGDGETNVFYGEDCDFGSYNSEDTFCKPGCIKNICGDSDRNLFEGCGPATKDDVTGLNYFSECLKFAYCDGCDLHWQDMACNWLYTDGAKGYCRFIYENTYCYDLNKEQCLQDDNCIYHLVEECDADGTIPFSDCTLNETTGTCTYCCDGTCTVQTKYSPTTCSDTDATGTYPSGENYYLQGQLNAFYEGEDISEYDTCYKNELTEQYCSADSIPNSTQVDCTQLNGLCQNGKCTCDCPRTGFDSTYKYCNYQRTGYTGTKPTIMSNDYPLNINDPTANTCCDSASKCVQKDGAFISQVSEGTKWDYGSTGKFTHICDDGMWVDFDSTQANCNLFGNGAVWAPGGISFVTTASTGQVIRGIEVIQVGEYNKVGEMECCGDDDDEELVSTYCSNSETNNVPTCCPDNTYKLINGQCVKECPSIERTAKVVIDVPSDEDLLTTINLLLKSENESLGCYPSTDTCSNFVVNLAPIHIPSPTPYAYCEDGQAVFRSGTSDDITVTDTTTSRSSPITDCEKTQFCVEEDLYSETLNSLPGDLENFLVFTRGTTTKGLVKYDSTKFTVDQKTIATYKTGTNCIPTNCEMKSIPVVQTATCYPTCEINSSNCFITCINEEPWTKFVFDGPGCTLTGDLCVVQDLVIEDYTVTKGATPKDAGGGLIEDNGRTPTEQYKKYSTSFSTETFCIPSNEDCIEEAICVSPTTTNLKGESVDRKMKIYDFYGNEYVQAVVSSHASVTGGEYWCPDGYEITEFEITPTNKEFVCKIKENVCAWGTTGHLTPNCDWSNMLNGEDVWGLYNDECFYDTDTSTLDQYEKSCCYSTSYGDIQVYEETYVKVY